MIGIIGGGHLGRALALALLDQGLPRDHLMVSHAGSPATQEELIRAGLRGNIADNAALCGKADILFLAVRPQSVHSLRGLPVREKTLVVSCMAGVPAEVLGRVLGVPVVRMMSSGPETLSGHNGIVAVYPPTPLLAGILKGIGQEVHAMPDETLMNVFTAGGCLPAILLYSRIHHRDPDAEIRPVIHEFPLMGALYAWGVKAVPRDLSDMEAEAYIARMSTKGGVTEAIITGMAKGEPLDAAFRAGIARCVAIGDEVGGKIR